MANNAAPKLKADPKLIRQHKRLAMGIPTDVFGPNAQLKKKK